MSDDLSGDMLAPSWPNLVNTSTNVQVIFLGVKLVKGFMVFHKLSGNGYHSEMQYLQRNSQDLLTSLQWHLFPLALMFCPF